MKKILVVGSKNTYRSIIIAEYIRKKLADNGGAPSGVSSAGIMAFPDIPAEAAAVEQLDGLGISGDFRSTPLSKQAVLDADMVITVSEKIKAAIDGKFPDKSGSVFYIKEMAGVPGELAADEKTGSEVSALVDACISKLL